MMRKLITLLSVCAVLGTGCERQPEVATAVQPPEPPPQQPAEAPQNKSIGSKVSNVMNQIGESSSEAATDVSRMAGDLFDDVTNSSSEAAQETADWVNSMYQKAKQTGQTSATSAKDWVVDDFQRGGSWQYRVVYVPKAPTSHQAALNELGKERWECYQVVPGSDRTVFYLKRRSRSVIRSLPARDLLRLVPLLGSGDGE